MLSSIHPLGERGRRNNFATTAWAFVIGSVLGGASTGFVLGLAGAAWDRLMGPVGEQGRLVAVLVAGVIALGFDLSGRSLPSVERQVNENWLGEFRGWVYGLGFGVQLGAGVLTYITAAVIVLWLAAMLVVGSVPGAVLIGATFGLTRGSSIVFARSITTPERLVAVHRRLHRSVGRVRLLTRAALAALTLATAFVAVGA